MQAFDLDKAIAAWRQEIITAGGSDAAFLTELESGLHDRYEDNLLRGMPPAEAFAVARDKVGRTASVAVQEHQKASQRSGWGLGFLLPSYLKTGLRTLRTRPLYNLVNYLCLTIGIVTATVAFLYLRSELQYDAATPNAENKYRIGMNLRSQGYSMISFPDYNGTAGDAQIQRVNAVAELPGVVSAVQFQTFPEKQLVRIGEREFPLENVLHTNTPTTFTEYFGWDFLLGSAAAFTASPNTAVLTVREAERYFGGDWRNAGLIGRALQIDTCSYTIAGVLPNPAPGTHFTYSIALNRDKIAYWGSRLYVEAGPGQTAASLKQTLDDNFADINISLAQNELFGGAVVQPLRSIHLESDLLYELKPPGKKAYLYIIGMMALLVLLLTVSNYTNLSVAMNSGRTREIGMRKVFGAGDGQIAGQFLLETALLGLLSFPAVMGALYVLLPRFDRLMGTAVADAGFWAPGLWGTVAGVALSVGLLAGLYPAFHLSRQRILGLFDSQLQPAGKPWFSARKAIVTLQFALLIGLCSLTLFVNRQLQFMQDKELGFDKERILYVSLNADSSRFVTFRDQVLNLSAVSAVGAGTPMGLQPYNQLTYKLEGQSEVFDDANNIYMDYESVALMGIETSVPGLVANPESGPRQIVLINNTLAERLKNRYGLTDAELVGRRLLQEPEYTDEETGEVGFPYEIAGTFGDVNMFSLRERVDPMFMTVTRSPRYVYTAIIRYQEDDPARLLAQVRTVYDRLNLDPVFNYNFLDDNLEDLYAEESRIATLSTIFSLIALLLALLGLVALTAYLTALRQREIGIRQVLGASEADILKRFNLEYLPLLGLALLIAAPLSWLVIDSWLKGFAYRISVEPWTFLAAAGVTLFITVLAVSTMTLRATRAVPARVL